ncbi:MAG: hypothetical protein AAFR47_05180 [Pseudomonadota bacterium]
MRILVDPDALVKAGIVTADQAEAMRAEARGALAGAGINAALFAGILAVIAGAVSLVQEPAQIAGLGLIVTALGALGLMRGGDLVRLPANAAAVIGTVMTGGGLWALIMEQWDRPVHAAWLGLIFVVPGAWLWRSGPSTLRFLAGWIVVLGAAVHLGGVLYGLGETLPPWLIWHYAFAVVLGCGLALDVRVLTGLSLVPLAGALTSRTFYSHASYSVAIYEVTLTLVQMALVAGVAWWIAARQSERVAGHLRLLALICVIWGNMALWIGSLWGDVVGETLWGPMTSAFRADDGVVDYEAWRAAQDAWEAGALSISPDVFSALWAVALVGVGLWSALTARRGLFNVAATFGAIHFYTQYFERLGTSPGAFIVAGLVAIAAAWGAWALNRRLAAE